MSNEKILWQILYTNTTVKAGRSMTTAVLTTVFTDNAIILTDLQGNAKETADKIWTNLKGGGILSELKMALGGNVDKLFSELEKLPDNQQVVKGGDSINMDSGKGLGYGYNTTTNFSLGIVNFPYRFPYDNIKKVVVAVQPDQGYCMISLKGLPFVYGSLGDIFMKASLEDKLKQIIQSTPLESKIEYSK